MNTPSLCWHGNYSGFQSEPWLKQSGVEGEALCAWTTVGIRTLWDWFSCICVSDRTVLHVGRVPHGARLVSIYIGPVLKNSGYLCHSFPKCWFRKDFIYLQIDSIEYLSIISKKERGECFAFCKTTAKLRWSVNNRVNRPNPAVVDRTSKYPSCLGTMTHIVTNWSPTY